MKIDNNNNVSGLASPGTKGVEGAGHREAARGPERPAADRAELSGRAGKLSEAIGKDAANRAATVERLRLEVAEGRYNPNPADVSRAVVGEALASRAAAGGTGEK